MDKINGSYFRSMLESGCANLNNRQQEINALNVFPVPDGDTGTNMSLTFSSGMNEVRKSGADDLPTVTKTLSRGMLMGARGNSGVILSQIFRGFHSSIKDQMEIGVKEFSAALMQGAMKAYKAVMRPTEGTILTVVRESAEYADLYVKDHEDCTFEEYMDLLCKEARASLDRTPDLLPVLKEARVVDSGGSGLCAVFDGFRACLEGAPITENNAREMQEAEEIKANGYCTEFILKLSDQGIHLFHEPRFREALSKLGDNITLVTDNDLVKVRMNSLQPGEVLNLGLRYGDFKRIQIDNLQEEQHPSILEEQKPVEEKDPCAEAKDTGIITVCAGDGLVKLFKAYRADIVVSGGQTMNPSTEDFVAAINRLNAKHIFILPNNSNIIMAAKQAAELSEDKDIIVLETKSVPEGLSACISFNPDDDAQTNKASMLDAIANVKSGSVTYAIKDTTVDGRAIKAGDFMGICGKDIRLTDPDKVSAACALIKDMVDKDSEIVTLIQGADATDEEAEKVKSFIENNFEVDVDAEKGDQPVYSFIIGVE